MWTLVDWHAPSNADDSTVHVGRVCKGHKDLSDDGLQHANTIEENTCCIASALTCIAGQEDKGWRNLSRLPWAVDRRHALAKVLHLRNRAMPTLFQPCPCCKKMMYTVGWQARTMSSEKDSTGMGVLRREDKKIQGAHGN